MPEINQDIMEVVKILLNATGPECLDREMTDSEIEDASEITASYYRMLKAGAKCSKLLPILIDIRDVSQGNIQLQREAVKELETRVVGHAERLLWH